jgi:LysR family transcriptional regulator, glycine cleavage system transcriptional activator
LCVDASAISHQVRLPEELLATLLFLRLPGKVELTADAASYFAALHPLLDELDRVSQAASRRAGGERLAVQTTPAFATRWLFPRLAQCRAVCLIRHKNRSSPSPKYSELLGSLERCV